MRPTATQRRIAQSPGGTKNGAITEQYPDFVHYIELKMVSNSCALGARASLQPISDKRLTITPRLKLVAEPFQIHSRPEVCEGIFARLDEYLDLEIERLSDNPPSQYRDFLLGFFRWAREELDADAYEELQRECIQSNEGPIKFLNLPYYARNKMIHVQQLKLHTSPPKLILDIGCGPGHFHLLARHFGHEVFGLDVPCPPDHIYHRLCAFFGAEKIDHYIEPLQPLPRFGRRFDLATIILVNLGPWGRREWQFLVEDIMENVIAEGGALFLSFTARRWTEDAWLYLSSIAEWTTNDRQAFIRRSLPI